MTLKEKAEVLEEVDTGRVFQMLVGIWRWASLLFTAPVFPSSPPFFPQLRWSNETLPFLFDYILSIVDLQITGISLNQIPVNGGNICSSMIHSEFQLYWCKLQENLLKKSSSFYHSEVWKIFFLNFDLEIYCLWRTKFAMKQRKKKKVFSFWNESHQIKVVENLLFNSMWNQIIMWTDCWAEIPWFPKSLNSHLPLLNTSEPDVGSSRTLL